MNCPFCTHPGADNRNYCGACGGLLVQYCRLCGTRNLAADHYCGGCGNPLATDGGQPPARPPSALPRAAPVPAPAAKPVIPATGAGLADLLDAARETEQRDQEPLDVKVSQDDIDSLFGD